MREQRWGVHRFLEGELVGGGPRTRRGTLEGVREGILRTRWE